MKYSTPDPIDRIGKILFIITITIFIGIYLIPKVLSLRSHTVNEPLADSSSLAQLSAGISIPKPVQEPFAQFHGVTGIPVPQQNYDISTSVLGDSSPSTNKHIEVDLTKQKVYAFEGDRKVYEFTVSTGKWGLTPTGEFTIWTKVKSQLMSGGRREIGTYYYLPGVPWVMFFYNSQVSKMRGFSFHGTYWHSNFGHPMSHGCVNMRTEDAKTLYDWATPVVTNEKAWSTLATAENAGTRVVIYGETPKE